MLPLLRKVQALYGWTLVALTDLAVTIPWVMVLYSAFRANDWPDAVPGAWLSLLVYGAAGLWEAGDRKSDGPSRTNRVVAAAVGMIGAYLIAYFVLPAPMRTGLLTPNVAWAYIPVAMYLWYQGTLAVAEGYDYHRIFDRFPYQVVGTAVGIILALKFGGVAALGVRVMLYWSVALLLAGGLLSMLVGREQQLREGQAGLGEDGAGGERQQSRALSITIICLLLLTFALSSLMGADRLEAVVGGAKDAVVGSLRFLGMVVYLVIYRWLLLLRPLIEWIMARMQAMARQQEGQDPGELLPDDLPPPEFIDTVPLDVNAILPYIQAALVIALVVAALVAVARISRKRKRRGQVEEEIISLGFWNNLLADLKSLFDGGAVAVKAALTPAEALDPRSPRMLFRRLQAWGERVGRPRWANETPATYRNVLSDARPAQAGEVSAVTEVYNRARYGASAPSEKDVAAAAEAVARLESSGPEV